MSNPSLYRITSLVVNEETWEKATLMSMVAVGTEDVTFTLRVPGCTRVVTVSLPTDVAEPVRDVLRRAYQPQAR